MPKYLIQQKITLKGKSKFQIQMVDARKVKEAYNTATANIFFQLSDKDKKMVNIENVSHLRIRKNNAGVLRGNQKHREERAKRLEGENK